MPLTPRLGLVYPVLADDPDVPDDMRKLALSIEEASIGWVAGDFKFSFQTADHDNFILCDGVSRARASLPASFNILMDAVLGADADPTKVRIPNFKRRSPMGADPGGANIAGVAPNPGATAGEESHLLTAAESGLRQHTHLYDEPNSGQGHNHGITEPNGGQGHSHTGPSLGSLYHSGVPTGIAGGFTGADGRNIGFDGNVDRATTGIGINRATTGITIRNVNPADAASSHNIIQPVLLGNWFIATGGGGSGTGGGGGGGSIAAPADVPLATANLASGAGESSTLPLGAGFRLLRVTADHPCRIRLYSRPDKRDTDVARPVGTDPPDYPAVDAAPNHGVMAEVNLTAANLEAGVYVQDLSPNVVGSSGETPRLNDIAYRVDNTDVAAHVINITFTSQVLEAV